MCHISASIVLRDSRCATLELPVRPDIASELHARAVEARAALGEKRLGEAMAYALLGSLISMDKAPAQPPTAAQVKFALDISRQLGVELPVGALQDRVVIGNFLTLYGDQLRRRGGSRLSPERVEKDRTISASAGDISPLPPE